MMHTFPLPKQNMNKYTQEDWVDVCYTLLNYDQNECHPKEALLWGAKMARHFGKATTKLTI